MLSYTNDYTCFIIDWLIQVSCYINVVTITYIVYLIKDVEWIIFVWNIRYPIWKTHMFIKAIKLRIINRRSNDRADLLQQIYCNEFINFIRIVWFWDYILDGIHELSTSHNLKNHLEITALHKVDWSQTDDLLCYQS